MEERLDEVLARPRFYTSTMIAFGAIALLVAVAGVYGVVSYTVLQRTREVGIRLALGITPSGVRAMLLAEALVPVAAGSAAGVLLAVVSARSLQTLVAGAGAAPLAAIAVGVMVTSPVAALSIWIATRHVARLDITDVLRAEAE